MTGGIRSEARSRVELGPGAEFDLVRSFLSGGDRTAPGVRVGPGDDALVLDDGLVVSTDLAVEDVHFRRSWLEDEEIGYRATAAGLSDLAAMAAEPLGALVSFALPASQGAEAATRTVAGVREALATVGGALLGGDLSTSPGPRILDVVSVGRAERPVLRIGARPGDELWVTGRLGAAAGAVRAWRAGGRPPRALREAFARPVPRVYEAAWLVREADVRALIDLSDGLAGDAAHLAAASGVRVLLDEERVPVHPALAELPVDDDAEEDPSREPLHHALHGGEDYELLLAAAPGSMEPLAGEFSVRFGVPLTRVGRVEEGAGVHVRSPEGRGTRPLERGGWDHFSGREASGVRADEARGEGA